MFEYHGWVVLRNAVAGLEDDAELEAIKQAIEKYIQEKQVEGPLEFYKVITVNGSYRLIMSGQRNHYRSEVLEVFNYITHIAQGSYGLLYILDDESRDEFNAFQVFVLSRGKVVKREDPFLSPCIPTIEDEYSFK